MARLARSAWLTRSIAVLLVGLGVPAVITAPTLLPRQAAFEEGEPAARTVMAPHSITVEDAQATARARDDAADTVEPRLRQRSAARNDIVAEVRGDFAVIDNVRASVDDAAGQPDLGGHVDALQQRVPELGAEGARLALQLSDEDIQRVASQAEDLATTLAQRDIRPGELEDARTQALQSELSARSFPSQAADRLVGPIIAGALRPTVRVDADATQSARESARTQVGAVSRTFPQGSEIVSAGEEVAPPQMAALRQAGLLSADSLRVFAEALLLVLGLGVVASLYLRAYRRRVWASPRRLLLLSVLLLAYAVGMEAVTLLVPVGQPGWLFVLPAGAVAMLATILLDPPIGVLSTIPMATLVALAQPGQPALVAFVALASLGSVPLVSRLSARGDLRKAAVRSTVGYAGLAALAVAAFGQPGLAPLAAGAGLVNGVATAIIVNGSLPFLESAFGMLTATSLLDLADRNHPMLRELEQKALGSYNHSVMVAQMTERACRAVGTDGLLGSVTALYHDIGKTARPYFFVENQFGVANPHDELEPDESARIIREHVPNGVNLGRRHRLPPEIIEGIACHHGTTLVSYFYRKARGQAAEPDDVDEADYRYPGPKPASKEMAIMMLADCCESAARAAALTNRNLTREDLVGIVYTLTGDRVADGQLDESALTFRELAVVQESLTETLVGVYHPRIAYPGQRGGDGDEEAATAAEASPGRRATLDEAAVAGDVADQP
jgi:putative nucleotidyltransferase with HDIG domain